ncbi:hypothetical protein C8R43DRAFT_1229876 [Mycena crocata]|nr:hypothetical protein C8R43DRAFT_1229876 [Mycena crocata]
MHMSQGLEQCRWDWCRNAYPTLLELLEHVRHDHVLKAQPVYKRDIPMLIRAEEGTGDSMSGMTMSFGNYSNSDPQHHSQEPVLNPSSSLPSPPASSPILHSTLPMIDFRTLNTPERSAKRRKMMPSVLSPSPSPSNSARPASRTPPARTTPSFETLASPPVFTKSLSNPELPDLDTLISNSVRGISANRPFRTPNRPSNANPGSQSFSGSDGSVERQLTQSIDFSFDDTGQLDGIMRGQSAGESQDLYAGELHWDDEPTQHHPRSRSPSPSQSSQSQSAETVLVPVPLKDNPPWLHSWVSVSSVHFGTS